MVRLAVSRVLYKLLKFIASHLSSRNVAITIKRFIE